MNEDAFVLQVRCYKLSPTMIFLSSWWNDYKKRKGLRPRSGRSGRKPISTCKCRSASASHDPVEFGTLGALLRAALAEGWHELGLTADGSGITVAAP